MPERKGTNRPVAAASAPDGGINSHQLRSAITGWIKNKIEG